MRKKNIVFKEKEKKPSYGEMNSRKPYPSNDLSRPVYFFFLPPSFMHKSHKAFYCRMISPSLRIQC